MSHGGRVMFRARVRSDVDYYDAHKLSCPFTKPSIILMSFLTSLCSDKVQFPPYVAQLRLIVLRFNKMWKGWLKEYELNVCFFLLNACKDVSDQPLVVFAVGSVNSLMEGCGCVVSACVRLIGGVDPHFCSPMRELFCRAYAGIQQLAVQPPLRPDQIFTHFEFWLLSSCLTYLQQIVDISSVDHQWYTVIKKKSWLEKWNKFQQVFFYPNHPMLQDIGAQCEKKKFPFANHGR